MGRFNLLPLMLLSFFLLSSSLSADTETVTTEIFDDAGNYTGVESVSTYADGAVRTVAAGRSPPFVLESSTEGPLRISGFRATVLDFRF